MNRRAAGLGINESHEITVGEYSMGHINSDHSGRTVGGNSTIYVRGQRIGRRAVVARASPKSKEFGLK